MALLGRGVQSITKKSEWPDWTPPAGDDRAPTLFAALYGRRFPANPLGARAMYLGGYHLSHPRHQRSWHHRQRASRRVASGLTNEDVCRSLFTWVKRRHQSDCVADGSPRRQFCRPAQLKKGHGNEPLDLQRRPVDPSKDRGRLRLWRGIAVAGFGLAFPRQR